MRATQEELDLRLLIRNPAFQRFLLQIANDAGIWIPTAGAEQSLPFREGQRSLGLEIIRKAAVGLRRDAGVTDVIAFILSESTPLETGNETHEQDESELRR